MEKKRLLMLMEIAIFASVGLVLDQISFKLWPQGGSISLVMLPILLIAIRWGLSAGLITGLLIGILQVVFGAYVLHWLQGLIDYGIAFTVVGFAAIFRKPILNSISASNNKKFIFYMLLATTFGGMLRFAAHLIAGVVFFKEFAGDDNVWMYSIIYNCTYMIPAIILTAIAAVLLFKASPKFIKID